MGLCGMAGSRSLIGKFTYKNKKVKATIDRGPLKGELNVVLAQPRPAVYKGELIRPDKPLREKSGKRIDAVPTAAMAVGAWKGRVAEAPAAAVPSIW